MTLMTSSRRRVALSYRDAVVSIAADTVLVLSGGGAVGGERAPAVHQVVAALGEPQRGHRSADRAVSARDRVAGRAAFDVAARGQRCQHVLVSGEPDAVSSSNTTYRSPSSSSPYRPWCTSARTSAATSGRPRGPGAPWPGRVGAVSDGPSRRPLSSAEQAELIPAITTTTSGRGHRTPIRGPGRDREQLDPDRGDHGQHERAGTEAPDPADHQHREAEQERDPQPRPEAAVLW